MSRVRSQRTIMVTASVITSLLLSWLGGRHTMVDAAGAAVLSGLLSAAVAWAIIR